MATDPKKYFLWQTKSPLAWVGGKAKLAQRICDLIPPHAGYREVFGGGGNVLLAKSPSQHEVYNDRNPDLVNFFRVVADATLLEEFYRLSALTPFAREEWKRFKVRLDDPSWGTPVERAWAWFMLNRMSFGGTMGGGWAVVVGSSSRGMSQEVSAFMNTMDQIEILSERLRSVVIENEDWRVILDRYDAPDALFYLDPPYVMETRVGGECYDYELGERDHHDLVERLLGLQGMAMLSGYPNPIYERLEREGWSRVDWTLQCTVVGWTQKTAKSVGAGRRTRTDSLWLSPAAQRQALDLSMADLVED